MRIRSPATGALLPDCRRRARLFQAAHRAFGRCVGIHHRVTRSFR